MRRLRERFPEELVVLGVHSAKFPAEKEIDNLRAAVLRHGIEHPVVNDVSFDLWQSFAVKAWPTVVLVDPTGRVVASQAGEIEADRVAPLIEELIATAGEQLDRAPLSSLAPEPTPDERLRFPGKVLAPGGERIFIADTGHHRILQVRLDGEVGAVETVYGDGRPGLRDGDAADASFHAPHGLAFLPSGDPGGGRLFVADTENHALRTIDLGTGTVTTLAGTGEKAKRPGGGGRPSQGVPLRSPWDLTLFDETLLIAMAGSHQIWALLPDGSIGVFAGTGQEALVDGPRAEAAFNQPSGIALGLGHLFVADSEASAVRAIVLNEDPRVITLVGQGLFVFGDQDGKGEDVRLQHPTGIAFGDGLLFLADSYNHKIKTLDPTTGVVASLIGDGTAGATDGPFAESRVAEPEGVSYRDGRLFIADTNNHRIRIADLTRGTLSTLRLEEG